MGAVLPGVSHATTPNNNVLNVKSEEKVYQSSFANSESLEGFEIPSLDEMSEEQKELLFKLAKEEALKNAPESPELYEQQLIGLFDASSPNYNNLQATQSVYDIRKKTPMRGPLKNLRFSVHKPNVIQERLLHPYYS
ncbi:hypothetical protein ACUC2M_12540 [Bacillus cytotoxicus]